MLGDNIRLLRSVRGISQVELGEKLNVSKQSISNWENGNIQPSIEMLMKIADFFSVSTDFLLSQKEGVPNKQLALVLSKISIIFSCENIGISIISNPKL